MPSLKRLSIASIGKAATFSLCGSPLRWHPSPALFIVILAVARDSEPLAALAVSSGAIHCAPAADKSLWQR